MNQPNAKPDGDPWPADVELSNALLRYVAEYGIANTRLYVDYFLEEPIRNPVCAEMVGCGVNRDDPTETMHHESTCPAYVNHEH